MLTLSLTISWAEKASDIDLCVAHDLHSCVLRVVPKESQPEVPVRVVAGLGDFEFEVKEMGIQAGKKRSGNLAFFWGLPLTIVVINCNHNGALINGQRCQRYVQKKSNESDEVQTTRKARPSLARFHRRSSSLELSLEIKDLIITLSELQHTFPPHWAESVV